MKKLFLFATIIFAFSCKKDTVTKSTPVVVFNTPAGNEHFINGNSIHITGTVTHNVELVGVAVEMTDLSNSNLLFHYHFSPGNKTSYAFDLTYVVPDNKKTSLKIEVEATDKNGTTGGKQITVTVN